MSEITFPLDPNTQTPLNEFSPESTPLASSNGVKYKWEIDGSYGVWRAEGGAVVGAPVAVIQKPLVLYPPTGSGMGYDNYFPQTSLVLTAPATSSDGTWKERGTPVYGSAGYNVVRYLKNKLFIVKSNKATANNAAVFMNNAGPGDPIRWKPTNTSQTLNTNLTCNYMDIAYGKLDDGSETYVCIGAKDGGKTQCMWADASGNILSETWTPTTSGWYIGHLSSEGRFTKITFGMGLFVTVAYSYTQADEGPYGLWSDDGGKNWNNVSIDKEPWYDIAYGTPSTGEHAGKEMFIAAAHNGNIAYSLTGKSFTTKYIAKNDESFQRIVYGDGMFVISVYKGLPLYSTDGLTWTEGTLDEPAEKFLGLAYGDGTWILNPDKDEIVYYSLDGKQWKAGRGAQNPGAGSHSSYGVDFAWDPDWGFVGVNMYHPESYESKNGTSGLIQTTTITLSDDKVYNDTSDNGQTIDEIFKAGTTVKSDDGAATGTLVKDAKPGDSPELILEDVTGVWAAGMKVASDNEITIYGPDADTMEFVGSVPTTDSGAVGKWGKAYWKVSENADMSNPMKAEVAIEPTKQQVLSVADRTVGGNDVVLTGDKTYYTTVKYDSDSPVAESAESIMNEFKTSGGAGGQFSTTLYTGVGATQPVETGVNNSNKSLVWIKARTTAHDNNHYFYDSERDKDTVPYGYYIYSNTGDGQGGDGSRPVVIVDNKTIKPPIHNCENSIDYVVWNFAAGAGFMDIVTYVGTGTRFPTNVIPHSLASVPAVIITKNISQASNWGVFHKDLTRGNYLWLESSNGQRTDGGNAFLSETDTDFTLGPNAVPNDAGSDYVAYLFADNPDAGIKCGSDSGGPATVDCGFKPDWVMIKRTDSVSRWYIMDNKRTGKALYADDVNDDQNADFSFTNTGFTQNLVGGDFIYVAIKATDTTKFYDATNYQSITADDITKRYAELPENIDLNALGIYELTEQPNYDVAYYEKEGNKYRPIRDYRSDINSLSSRIAALGGDTVAAIPEPEPTPTPAPQPTPTPAPTPAPTPTPTPTPTNTTYTVTVQQVGYSNKYFINGVQQDSLQLTKGQTYIFDTSDSSNSGHPLRIYTSSTKNTEYTSGVTVNSDNTTFVVPSNAPGTLHYQCAAHNLMGGVLNIS